MSIPLVIRKELQKRDAPHYKGCRRNFDRLTYRTSRGTQTWFPNLRRNCQHRYCSQRFAIDDTTRSLSDGSGTGSEDGRVGWEWNWLLKKHKRTESHAQIEDNSFSELLRGNVSFIHKGTHVNGCLVAHRTWPGAEGIKVTYANDRFDGHLPRRGEARNICLPASRSHWMMRVRSGRRGCRLVHEVAELIRVR